MEWIKCKIAQESKGFEISKFARSYVRSRIDFCSLSRTPPPSCGKYPSNRGYKKIKTLHKLVETLLNTQEKNTKNELVLKL